MADYIENLLATKLKRLHCAEDVCDEWRTPDLEFLAIEKLFAPGGKFAIDLFTDGVINSKADHFFTAEQNALKQDWGDYCKKEGIPAIGFANPPYSQPHKGRTNDGGTCTGLVQMMKKAEIEMSLGFYSVWLVPNNPEASWFPIESASKIIFVTGGRLTFDVPEWYKQNETGSKPTSARGGACIIIFDPVIYRTGFTNTPELKFLSRQVLRETGAAVLEQRENEKVKAC